MKRDSSEKELETLRLEMDRQTIELETLRWKREQDRQEMEELRLELEEQRLRMQKQGPPPEAVGGLTWEFEGKDGVWTRYNSDHVAEITQSYLRGEKTCTLVHDGGRYEIILHDNAMEQRNCVTGKRRKIRYNVGVPEHWSRGDIIRQLKMLAGNVALGATGLLTLETILKPIKQREMLEEFSGLLHDSVFHHHHWHYTTSSCDMLKRQFLVCEAYHVENSFLYEGYRNHCRHLQSKHLRTGVVPESIWPDVGWCLWGFGEKLGIVDSGLNERLLFHGTSFETAKQIAQGGFDSRVAKLSGMYGQGTYFAAQSCKSHQYAKPEGALHTMLLARVALGDPHYAQKCDKDIRRPPKRESLDASLLCDSLIAAPGRMEGHNQGWQSHVEFVIFEQMQAYPEYILRYRLA